MLAFCSLSFHIVCVLAGTTWDDVENLMRMSLWIALLLLLPFQVWAEPHCRVTAPVANLTAEMNGVAISDEKAGPDTRAEINDMLDALESPRGDLAMERLRAETELDRPMERIQREAQNVVDHGYMAYPNSVRGDIGYVDDALSDICEAAATGVVARLVRGDNVKDIFQDNSVYGQTDKRGIGNVVLLAIIILVSIGLYRLIPKRRS